MHYTCLCVYMRMCLLCVGVGVGVCVCVFVFVCVCVKGRSVYEGMSDEEIREAVEGLAVTLIFSFSFSFFFWFFTRPLLVARWMESPSGGSLLFQTGCERYKYFLKSPLLT